MYKFSNVIGDGDIIGLTLPTSLRGHNEPLSVEINLELKNPLTEGEEYALLVRDVTSDVTHLAIVFRQKDSRIISIYASNFILGKVYKRREVEFAIPWVEELIAQEGRSFGFSMEIYSSPKEIELSKLSEIVRKAIIDSEDLRNLKFSLVRKINFTLSWGKIGKRKLLSYSLPPIFNDFSKVEITSFVNIAGEAEMYECGRIKTMFDCKKIKNRINALNIPKEISSLKMRGGKIYAFFSLNTPGLVETKGYDYFTSLSFPVSFYNTPILIIGLNGLNKTEKEGAFANVVYPIPKKQKITIPKFLRNNPWLSPLPQYIGKIEEEEKRETHSFNRKEVLENILNRFYSSSITVVNGVKEIELKEGKAFSGDFNFKIIPANDEILKKEFRNFIRGLGKVLYLSSSFGRFSENPKKSSYTLKFSVIERLSKEYYFEVNNGIMSGNIPNMLVPLLIKLYAGVEEVTEFKDEFKGEARNLKEKVDSILYEICSLSSLPQINLETLIRYYSGSEELYNEIKEVLDSSRSMVSAYYNLLSSLLFLTSRIQEEKRRKTDSEDEITNLMGSNHVLRLSNVEAYLVNSFSLSSRVYVPNLNSSFVRVRINTMNSKFAFSIDSAVEKLFSVVTYNLKLLLTPKGESSEIIIDHPEHTTFRIKVERPIILSIEPKPIVQVINTDAMFFDFDVSKVFFVSQYLWERHRDFEVF
ncbi:hypothetical protein [Acidianus sp. HS-5]|uniref:hypothetical protein n=1 Tax=Acidianus sp. HS-5 TaxID=2886040 RepID=UPI001F1C7445|nr:hypothetical protein [Acidianus sp. HS-5]BDC17947.1 hypothetical protein HS5_08370 [Acidianus sp. HS-5]